MTRGPGLRRGMSIPRTTDILLVVLSAETYRALARRGWSARACERWLVDVLAQQLCEPARAVASRG
jgi:hypothetical protein